MSTGNFPWTISITQVAPADFSAAVDSAVASAKLVQGPDGGPMPLAQSKGLDAAASALKALASVLQSNTTVGGAAYGSTRTNDTSGLGPFVISLSVSRG